MKTRSLLILAGFCLASVMAFAQQSNPSQAPTLADIARQKRAEKAKKVFTSEDMKAAEAVPAAPAEGTGEAAKTATAAPKNPEEVAAAQAKVDDLRDREILLNKNIARFETSLSTATQEGNEDRAKSFQESIDAAKTALAEATQNRIAAEKALDDIKAAAAAAAAKKPARKPAAPAPKS